MKKGDVIRGENGMEFIVGEALAYMGKEGCKDVRCRRRYLGEDGYDWTGCMDYHCPRCHEPCSSQGHHKCLASGVQQ